MLVFRKCATQVSASNLRSELAARLDLHEERPRRATLLPLLLRASELETALADADSPCAADAARFTDALAEAFVADAGLTADASTGSGTLGEAVPRTRRWLAAAPLPETLTLRRPEGYAFYALDPARYVAAARSMVFAGPRVTVLGVRSIGAGLSAVVAATLRQRGLDVGRASVRPGGHPWNRQLGPDDPALVPVREGRGGEVLVVDEGPGLSGSTFLAVAEATVRAGTPARQIRLVCSHRPDPRGLRAPDALRRWQQFRVVPVEASAVPSGWSDLSAGQWRARTHARARPWPASWRQLERVKLLSPDGTELRRFVGYPPYGDRAAATAALLADGGYAPAVLGNGDGFVSLRWHQGQPLSDVDEAPVGRIAEYLAFRTQHLPATDPTATLDELREMLEVNVGEATGASLPRTVRLDVVAPVVPDARMLPHEWLRTTDGPLLKVDGHDHGDDHLFPGPCDAAWDLAGATVEWELTAAQQEHLLEAYRFRTNDDVRGRLGAYVLAYAAFRVGWSTFAQGSADAEEGERLRVLERRYRRALATQLASMR